jgi:hypothetical protein
MLFYLSMPAAGSLHRSEAAFFSRPPYCTWIAKAICTGKHLIYIGLKRNPPAIPLSLTVYFLPTL